MFIRTACNINNFTSVYFIVWNSHVKVAFKNFCGYLGVTDYKKS